MPAPQRHDRSRAGGREPPVPRDVEIVSGRTPAGLAMLLLGGIWIAQGMDALKGSFMTGVPFWAWAGVALVIGGLGMIGWDLVRAVRRRRAPSDDQ